MKTTLKKDSTYTEYLGEGYRVTIQHCDECGTYLGTNYPSYWCTPCRQSIQHRNNN